MISEALLKLLIRNGVTLATAESCTGGLLAGAVTAREGASTIFDRGFVCYSNPSKVEVLGVRQATLDAHGAVSEEVAREMAEGARKRARVTIALSVTGIAGPGPSERKPEGRVCFGLASAIGTRVETVEFGAIGRDRVRQSSVDHALRMLRLSVQERP